MSDSASVSHAVIYVTFIYQQRSSAAAAAAKTSGLPYSTGVKIDSWLSSNTAEISLKCLTCCNKLGATISYICPPPTYHHHHHTPTLPHRTVAAYCTGCVFEALPDVMQVVKKKKKKKKLRWDSQLHLKTMIHLIDTVSLLHHNKYFAPHSPAPPSPSLSVSQIWLSSQNLRENQVVLLAWRTPPPPSPSLPHIPPSHSRSPSP